MTALITHNDIINTPMPVTLAVDRHQLALAVQRAICDTSNTARTRYPMTVLPGRPDYLEFDISIAGAYLPYESKGPSKVIPLVYLDHDSEVVDKIIGMIVTFLLGQGTKRSMEEFNPDEFRPVVTKFNLDTNRGTLILSS